MKDFWLLLAVALVALFAGAKFTSWAYNKATISPPYVRGYAAAVDSVKAVPVQHDSLTTGQQVVGIYDALGVRYTIVVLARPDSVSGMVHLGVVR